MLELIVRLFKWLFEAVYVYAASDEGGAELKAILDEAERDGIDVPFYEPDEGVQEESEGAQGSRVQNSLSQDELYAQMHEVDND